MADAEELQKQLAVLQSQYMESNRRIETVQAKANLTMRHKRRAALMEHEICSPPEPEKVYRSVGRMYLISSKEEMVCEIEDTKSDCDKKLKILEAQHKYLADDNVGIQKALQEFIMQNSGEKRS
mmetsp:Transcript_14437/g.41004  ORF Transcript_14437/g.41004 Transcript_14437/m.41004 type:complete len:124 (+) Transcript_14437:206-577(+)